MKKQKDSTSNFFSSKKRMKKAQAAMEFLMTYGWTLLVVLMAGAALVYFDVLNPGKFLPDNCNVQGFLCTDFKISANDGDGAQLFLTNNVGDDLEVTKIDVGGKSAIFTTTLQIGKANTFTIPGDFGSSGDRYKKNITITYTTTTSGITHKGGGMITTTIED